MGIVVVGLGLVWLTAGAFAADARHEGWSPGRQAAGALIGRTGCGLADEIGRGDEVAQQVGRDSAATLIVPAFVMFVPCARAPRVVGGLVEIPETVILDTTRWPLSDPSSPFGAVPDLYSLRLIARGPQGVTTYRVDRRVPALARVDAVRIG